MQRVLTLKEFEKEFYPTRSKTWLADMLGISLSVHSKIYHNDYSDTSPEWFKVKDYINDNYDICLVKDHKIYELKMEYEGIISEKDKRIKELEERIKKLKVELSSYEQIDKCVKYLYENRERLR